MKSVNLINILEDKYEHYTLKIVDDCYIFFDELSVKFDIIEFKDIKLVHKKLFDKINESSRKHIINIIGGNYDVLTHQQKNNLDNFIKGFYDAIYIDIYELSYDCLTNFIFNSLKNIADSEESRKEGCRQFIKEITIIFFDYFKRNKSNLLQDLKRKLRNSLTTPEVFIIEGLSKIDKKIM